MKVYFNFDEFMEANVKSINTRAEKHGPDERHAALDINFCINVPANFLNKLSISDKVDYEKFYYDKDGQLKNLNVEELGFGKHEFEEYFMSISFSGLRTKDDFQRFKVERICKFKAELLHGKCVDLHFQVQLHPFEKEDIGMLVKEGLEKPTYIKFENMQNDLVDAAGESEEEPEAE